MDITIRWPCAANEDPIGIFDIEDALDEIANARPAIHIAAAGAAYALQAQQIATGLNIAAAQLAHYAQHPKMPERLLPRAQEFARLAVLAQGGASGLTVWAHGFAKDISMDIRGVEELDQEYLQRKLDKAANSIKAVVEHGNAAMTIHEELSHAMRAAGITPDRD